uniref:Uncharacterized protein n=1 Tax=Urocitellus parryii TaxID=9999 RepID=A0A8D2IAB5_UROPR
MSKLEGLATFEIREYLIQNLEIMKTLFLIPPAKDGFEETTDDTLTEGEESYFEEDSDLEDLEGSSSSFPYDDTESASREPPGQPAEEAEEEPKKKISESFFYDYNELASMPFVTPTSNIPLDFLVLVYPLQLHMHNLGI